MTVGIAGLKVAFRFCAICLLACLWLSVAGCARSQEEKASGDDMSDRPAVLLVIMDTTRADRFGCYGSELGITANLDKLAASGIRFTNANSHAPWTLPAIASLFTSNPPVVHGAGGAIGQFTSLSDRVATLAEVFTNAGYETGAVMNVFFLSEKFGLTRGFEHVDYFKGTTNTRMRSAASTTDAALKWLKSVGDKPYFMVVHYFDPHLIYLPPDEFRERFADPLDRGSDCLKFGNQDDMMSVRQNKTRLDKATVKRLEKLYNGEVAYVDREVGRLLDFVHRQDSGRKTVIAVTADHGEEFFDHGGFEHGHTVYQELLHVPLILAGFDIPKGMVVDQLVGLVDVAPTLCDLAGVEIPSDFSGQTLLPAMGGSPLLERAVLSEGNMWGPLLFSLNEGKHKLIRLPSGYCLYDLEEDPGEKNNLLMSKPGIASAMTRNLTVLLEQLALRNSLSGDAVTLTPEERERLCALGYLDCE